MKNHLPALLIATTTLALTTPPRTMADNGWVEGLVSGIDTLVTVGIHLHTYLSDYEDSVVTTGVERYQFDTSVRYPFGNHSYQTRWMVFQDLNGTYQYRTLQTLDGVVQPVLSDVFELGTSGLPLTKRQWSCSQQTPTLWFEASSTSTLRLKMKHTVTKAASYSGHAPASYECQASTAGRFWVGTCDPNPILGDGSWNVAKTLPRNGQDSADYTATNIEVEEIWGKVKQ